jgi:hypothetical protein
MQYILVLKKINKLLIFYNYKSRAKSTSSYFYAVFLVVRLYKTNKINFKQL